MTDSRYRRVPYSRSAVGVLMVGCVLMALASGCEREDIHAYRIQREQDFTQVRSSMVAAPSEMHREVDWDAPATWTESATTSSVRIATFQSSGGIEIAVTAFPGDVGGLLANVNRWRGQIGLAPTDEQGLAESVEIVGMGNVAIIDMTGESSRLLGAIIQIGDGKTWFVKGVGEGEKIELLKDELVGFANSFRAHNHSGGSDTPAADPSTAPPADAGMDASSWTKPTEWTPDAQASSMLIAAYNADSGARITLTSLSGDGGGIMSNINRWRGQLQLPPVASIAEQPITDLGGGALIVDLLKEDGSERIVAGIVPGGGQVLFFKLTGTGEATATEMQRFEEFVRLVGVERPGRP